MTTILRIVVTAIVFSIVFSASVFAQETTTKTTARNSPVIQHWLNIADEMAKKQTIVSTDDAAVQFKLREKAIFRHTQPLRGDDIGSVYVWTSKNERPAVIGVFFAWSQGDNRWVMQEFHSLYAGPIQKTMTGETTWVSRTPGFTWMTMPSVSVPHKDPRKQKIQAKQIPRKLKVVAAKSASERHPLRVVPTPFYEYSDVDAGIEYGAIYGFCQGTDTELIVLVESHVDDDSREWRYALAPFTDYRLEVTQPDGSVWKSPDGKLAENGKPHYWDFVELMEKPDFEKTR